MLCPCWYGVKELMVIDQGWCASPWLIRISEGTSEGVDLSGCDVVLAMFFPGPTLLDGDGTGRLYLDHRNGNEQRRELEEIFMARKGGPMDVVGSLLSTWLSPQVTRIDVSDSNGSIEASVGEFGRILSNRLVNEEGDKVTMRNAGFSLVWRFADNTAELAPSEGSIWQDPDMPVAWRGSSGAVGQIHWEEG
jgi:hypothetical protein